MCRFVSAIVIPDGVLCENMTDSHEYIIGRYGLEDGSLETRRFVRVECVPTDKGWQYSVDEKGSLPEWYIKSESKHKARVIRAAQERLRGLRSRRAPRESFCGVDLCESDLSGAVLCGANLYGANLRRVDLCGANLCGANLREVNLYGANLRKSDLRRVDLSGANLCEADLRDANLCRANLCDANLRKSDLCGANLCGANLRKSDLRRVDLSGADLCGANLCGADLCGANLRDANLYGTVMPDGTIHN